jgi:hypothetical protein
MAAFLGFLAPGPQPSNRPPVRGRIRFMPRRRWLIAMALPFALVLSLTAVLAMQEQCGTKNDCLLLEDGGGCLLAESGSPLIIGQHKECDSLVGRIRSLLPRWGRLLAD